LSSVITTEAVPAPSLQRRLPLQRYACYAALLLAFMAMAAIRVRLRNAPLERDEGEYAYMGQLMLHGVPPYEVAYNMKLPGTYAAYALLMAVFGETTAGIRLGMIVVTTATAFLVFLLGKRLHGLIAGTVAGVTYIFLAIRPSVMAIDGHATHFVVLAALAGLLLLLHAMERQKPLLFFASGLAFGVSYLMKQPGILFGVFAGVHWLWNEAKRPFLWRRVLLRGSALLLGAALPYGFTCLVMVHAGVFQTFWFWTWRYALEYGTLTSLSNAWIFLKATLPWAVRPLVLWALVLLGLAAPLWSRRARAHAGLVAGFFITGWLVVSSGLYFRPHYYIAVLPAAAVCVGIAVESMQSWLMTTNFKRLALIPILYFAAAYCASVHGQWKTYLSLEPAQLTTKMHLVQVFAKAVGVAELIQSSSSPGDQIGIIGSEPEICFYTRLRCTGGYLYMYPLMEKQKYAKEMQDDLRSSFERRHPRFLVYVDAERSWGWEHTLRDNRAFFDWAWAYSHSGYTLVKEVPIPSDYEEVKSDHLWGDRAQLYLFESTDELAAPKAPSSPTKVSSKSSHGMTR